MLLRLNAYLAYGAIVGLGFVGASSWFTIVKEMDQATRFRQVERPLDLPSERLERPRPEQDRLSRPRAKPMLSHAEVIGLAKAVAKKDLGKRFDDYEVKNVVFEPGTGLWSVSFDPKPPRCPSDGCLIVFVHDEDKTADFRHCAS